MTRTISPVGLAFIEKWEELVLYVYDDKVPKRRINGVLKYPEWDGGRVFGTLTIGYGHTDAAGWPKIVQGMHITKEQADEILTEDLRGCIAAVDKVTLPLTQHETDTLISFDFNCGDGNLRKLIKGFTEDDYKAQVPRRLMQFVSSKGERMQGLVNRRAGEVKMWGTLDEPEAEEHLAFPKGERNDPPKSIATSKSGNTSILAGGAGASVALSSFNDFTSSLNGAKSNIHDLGVLEYIAHLPAMLWVGLLIVAAGGYLYYDRHKKLTEEQV